MIQLRDYQIRSIKKIRDAYANGFKRPILRLDCGAGKTITSAWMAIESAARGNEVLFLVHRKELLDQTYETFKSLNANMDKIKIGMVITVGNHLSDYNPKFIIADECNFALSKTWRKVLDHYSDAWVLGLSATPARLDGKPMGDIFDIIISDLSANELIQLGRLSPYDYYAPKLDINLSDVESRAGDYKQEQLESIMNKPKIYGDIIKYYKQIPHHKTLVYCTTIKHSELTAQIFRDNGYRAEHIDSNLSKSERDRIVHEFKHGDIEVLCNCDIVSFGFDIPDCDTVMLLRPTQSLTLYIQQSMRGMRYQPGKRATIYDFVGNCYRHGMPTDNREWSLSTAIRTRNPSGVPELLVRQCVSCLRVYSGTAQICPYCKHDNGQTREQIKQQHDAELEQIRTVDRRKQGMAKTLADLLVIERERGYKKGWAYRVYNSRRNKSNADNT